MKYAEIIRSLRDETGKSQDEMAELLDMAFMSYSHLELHGDELGSVPSLCEVKKMCDIFGIRPRVLLGGTQNLAHLPISISFQELMMSVITHIAEKGRHKNNLKID
jgi:transcriptional regulator with XRE-family HTH domain